MSSEGKAGRQAAGRPEGNADTTTGRAWIRTSFPEGGQAPLHAGSSFRKPRPMRGRAVYVRELPGGGCLILNEDGTHREAPKLSPPEGDGWEALHDERGLKDQDLAQNRWSSKQNRKIKAEAELAKRLDALAAPLPEGHPMQGLKQGGEGIEGEGSEGGIDPLLPPRK